MSFLLEKICVENKIKTTGNDTYSTVLNETI